MSAGFKFIHNSTTVWTGVNGNPFKIAFDGTWVWDTLPFHQSIARFNVNTGAQRSNLVVGGGCIVITNFKFQISNHCPLILISSEPQLFRTRR